VLFEIGKTPAFQFNATIGWNNNFSSIPLSHSNSKFVKNQDLALSLSSIGMKGVSLSCEWIQILCCLNSQNILNKGAQNINLIDGSEAPSHLNH
jgi:hypothetical protein